MICCLAALLYCIVFKYLYSAPQQPWQTEALLVQLAPRKETSLRSDKDVERSADKKDARAEGGRRFQRKGPITEKDPDMTMVVLV